MRISKLLRRPSPATVIACIALFAAFGGTAWAATKIRGRDVADRSLTYRDIAVESIGTGEVNRLRGRDLRRATVGGYQTDEATLGKVPSAVFADRVGGLEARKFSARIGTDAPEQEVVTVGGLTLFASCPGGDPSVRATTATNDADVSGSVIAAGDVPRGGRNRDFDLGESFDVDQGFANANGTVSYAQPGGTVASVSVGLGDAPSFGATVAGCAVYGTGAGG